MAKLLVSGATGFVGRAAVPWLIREGWSVRVAVRSSSSRDVIDPSAEVVQVDDINGLTDWQEALADVTHVLHLAGHAHEQHVDDEVLHAVNVEGTSRFAQEAAQAGVKRFVFVSSIKAMAEASDSHAITDDDRPLPSTAYGRSKLAAEKALQDIVHPFDMEYVIIRPTLVYGRGAVGNFQRLMVLLARGVPLPLAGLRNRRSLVDVMHLVSLMALCLNHPAAAGQTFIAADDTPLSTSALIRLLAQGMERPARLFPMPAVVMQLAAIAFRRQDEAEKLLGSLEVDASKARQLLGWQSASSSEPGLIEMARHYVQRSRG